jgi:F0F1-type ATP synthase assembly protein I
MSGSEKPDPRQKQIDPWSITGHIISGMLVYGAVGWGIDHWAGTGNVFTPIGVIFGLAAGLFLTFRQLSVLEKQERAALVRKRQYEPPEQQDTASPQDLHDPQDNSDTQHD